MEANYELLQDGPPIRSLCLGEDWNQNRYWYFEDCRLYKEIPTFESVKSHFEQSDSQGETTPTNHCKAKATLFSDVADCNRKKMNANPSQIESSATRAPDVAAHLDESDLSLDSDLEAFLLQQPVIFSFPSLSSRRMTGPFANTDVNCFHSNFRRSSRLLIQNIVASDLKEEEERTERKRKAESRKKRKLDLLNKEKDVRPIPTSYKWTLCAPLWKTGRDSKKAWLPLARTHTTQN